MVVLDDGDLVKEGYSLSLFQYRTVVKVLSNDPWMIYWERVVFFSNRLKEVKS